MKSAFFHVHFGIGDLFYSIGAIRYLATQYDEVRVPYPLKHRMIFFSLFHDVPNVKMICSDMFYSNTVSGPYFIYDASKNCDLFLCGEFKINRTTPVLSDTSPYPYCFYDDIGLERSIMKDYFYIPRLPMYKKLWEQMPERYIFIHEQWSGGHVDIFSKLNTDLLVLDPNKNHYQWDHPYHKKAQLAVGKQSPVWHIYLIENAEELHLVESCYVCLAHQLDLSKVKVKKGYLKREGDSIKTFGIFQRD